MLLSHIVIALSSVILASVAAISPNRTLLRTNFVLATLTLASGTYLVLTGAPVLQSCLSGVAYLSLVYVLLAIARTRLARLETSRRSG